MLGGHWESLKRSMGEGSVLENGGAGLRSGWQYLGSLWEWEGWGPDCLRSVGQGCGDLEAAAGSQPCATPCAASAPPPASAPPLSLWEQPRRPGSL